MSRHLHYAKPAAPDQWSHFIGCCTANGVVIALADHEIIPNMATKRRHGNINSLQRGVVRIRDVKLNAAFAERQAHPEGAGFPLDETEMIAFNKVKMATRRSCSDIRIARDQRRIIQRNMHIRSAAPDLPEVSCAASGASAIFA